MGMFSAIDKQIVMMCERADPRGIQLEPLPGFYSRQMFQFLPIIRDVNVDPVFVGK